MIPETEKMTSADMVERLTRERDLIIELNTYLEKELVYITNEDMEALEDSMPDKYRVLQNIASNREGFESNGRGSWAELADQIRGLKQELVGLWRKASGLNDLSKSMVSSRLKDIGRQMEIFFTGDGGGYTRNGTKSRTYSRIVKTGV